MHYMIGCKGNPIWVLCSHIYLGFPAGYEMKEGANRKSMYIGPYAGRLAKAKDIKLLKMGPDMGVIGPYGVITYVGNVSFVYPYLQDVPVGVL